MVELQFLGFGERPVVLGLDGLDDTCPARVAGIVMAGVVHALDAVGRVVGRVDIAGGRIDRLRIHGEGMPALNLIGGVGSVDGGFGVHVVWSNRKLGAGPPGDVAFVIAVHEVDAGGMDEGGGALHVDDVMRPGKPEKGLVDAVFRILGEGPPHGN